MPKRQRRGGHRPQTQEPVSDTSSDDETIPDPPEDAPAIFEGRTFYLPNRKPDGPFAALIQSRGGVIIKSWKKATPKTLVVLPSIGHQDAVRASKEYPRHVKIRPTWIKQSAEKEQALPIKDYIFGQPVLMESQQESSKPTAPAASPDRRRASTRLSAAAAMAEKVTAASPASKSPAPKSPYRSPAKAEVAALNPNNQSAKAEEVEVKPPASASKAGSPSKRRRVLEFDEDDDLGILKYAKDCILVGHDPKEDTIWTHALNQSFLENRFTLNELRERYEELVATQQRLEAKNVMEVALEAQEQTQKEKQEKGIFVAPGNHFTPEDDLLMERFARAHPYESQHSLWRRAEAEGLLPSRTAQGMMKHWRSIQKRVHGLQDRRSKRARNFTPAEDRAILAYARTPGAFPGGNACWRVATQRDEILATISSDRTWQSLKNRYKALAKIIKTKGEPPALVAGSPQRSPTRPAAAPPASASRLGGLGTPSAPAVTASSTSAVPEILDGPLRTAEAIQAAVKRLQSYFPETPLEDVVKALDDGGVNERAAMLLLARKRIEQDDGAAQLLRLNQAKRARRGSL